jgi:hypothetical protein
LASLSAMSIAVVARAFARRVHMVSGTIAYWF